MTSSSKLAIATTNTTTTKTKIKTTTKTTTTKSRVSKDGLKPELTTRIPRPQKPHKPVKIRDSTTTNKSRTKSRVPNKPEPTTLDAYPPSTLFERIAVAEPHPSERCCHDNQACTRTRYCGSCRACDLCGKIVVRESVYRCTNPTSVGPSVRGSVYVHLRCADLKSELGAEDFQFKLHHRVDDKNYSKCILCSGKKPVKSANIYLLYWNGNMSPRVSFHVSCLSRTMESTKSSASKNMDSCIDHLRKKLGAPRLRLQIDKTESSRLRSVHKIGKAIGSFLNMVLQILPYFFGDPTVVFTCYVVRYLLLLFIFKRKYPVAKIGRLITSVLKKKKGTEEEGSPRLVD